MVRHLLCLSLLVGGLTFTARPVHADDASLEAARVSFEKGQGLFQAGKYAEAAGHFEAALAARPFPQFLFNIGACHEKLGDYARAITYYQRYIAASPDAPDRKNTERRIAALEQAIDEVRGAPPADPAAPPAEAPRALADVGAAGIKGVVVIESDPPDALIYLDNKKGRPLARTPWNGELSGEHTLYLEREGYKPVERRISPSADKFLEVVFVMAEEDYLGWVNITSNVPGADIYIDDKAVGVYNRTPFQGNLPPGKHEIWVTKEGYDEFHTSFELAAAERKQIVATLTGSPVGYVNIRGRDIEKTATFLDGQKICDGACIHAVPQGEHQLTIKREGYKPYSTRITVKAKTETTVRAHLAERPGRADAVVAYVFAGVFIGGGIWAGREARALEDELAAEIAAGAPPPARDDPRFTRGKAYAIGADAAFVVGGASLLAAVYYTLRDKGAPSTGTTDVRAIALTPEVAPGYAGVGMEVRW
jgi:outer membrane receptor for ferrienterochelin and colicins